MCVVYVMGAIEERWEMETMSGEQAHYRSDSDGGGDKK